MSPRRWTDTLGPPLLAATAIIVFVAPTLGGTTQRRAAGRAPIQVATPVACAASPGSPQLQRAVGPAWYRLDPVINAAGGLDGQRLVGGRGDDHVSFQLVLGVESFASGLSRGQVLVGTDDGQRSIVRRIDVATGCAAVVHEGPDLIRRAVLDPSGAGIVEFRLDRASRADLGIWSRPGDGSDPRRLLDPLPPNRRIGRVFATQLSWSDDGTRLVVTSCGESFCLARILDSASGRVTTIDDERAGEVLGLVGDELIAYGACPTLPCDIVALNVPSGRVRVVAPLAGLAAASVANGRPVVVFEDFHGDGRLLVAGLDGNVLRSLPVGDGLRLIPASDRALAAVELPRGVIAVATGSRPAGGTPTSFIYLADGRQLSAAEVSR